MPETVIATVDATTTTTTPAVITPVVDTTVVKEPDLITKVTNFKKPAPAVQSDTYKDFEEITDPKAKEIAINRDKARQADYTRKTQELATQRKDIELQIQEMQNWTPEKIQKYCLNNPKFLEAAQQIAPSQNPSNNGLTEDFSTLNDVEKAKLAQVDSLKNQVDQLTQSNLQSRINVEIAQTDAQLQTKFSDYNPIEINQATETLSRLNLSSVREYVYKAQKHDEHVAAAYELGRQEALGLNKEKANAIGLSGIEANASNTPLPKNKSESDVAYFVRLAQDRLAQSRKK